MALKVIVASRSSRLNVWGWSSNSHDLGAKPGANVIIDHGRNR